MAVLLVLATCLSVGLGAAVEDASGLVQSRVVRATSQELEQKAESEVIFTVMASMTTNKVGKCQGCWETGFALKCRGKTVKFTFEPTLDQARVVNKFARTPIGWSPQTGVYHNLTVVLRSTNEHTFMITDASGAPTWSKDFKRKKMYPANDAQLEKCKLRTIRKNKKLDTVGEAEGKQCYGRTRKGLTQEHCMYLAEEPFRRGTTYVGSFGAPPPPSLLCYGKGDPHYKPYKGRKFNFQGNGTYMLSRITEGPFQHTLQAFNCPVKPGKNGKQKKVSQAVGVAFSLDGHKFQFFNGTVKVDGGEPEPYGSRMPVGETKLKMDVSDRNLIVDGETGSGTYIEIRVTMRGGIKTSRFDYVLDVYANVPLEAFDAEPTPTGLCAGKDTRCEGTFLPYDAPSNLFLLADSVTMEQTCCPNGGCASPCVGGEVEDPTLEEICAAAEPEDGRKVTVAEALDACEECGDDEEAVQACAMDYCEDPDDGDAIVMEACEIPDEPTYPIPDVKGTPGGRADPHCRNVLGEAFDVLAVGQLDFLKVPRFAPPAEQGRDLHVQALIEPISRSHRCVPTVITQLTVSGSWLQRTGEEPLVISPGPQGKPQMPQAWVAQLNLPRSARLNSSQPVLTSWEWRDKTTLSVFIRGVDIRINQRTGTKSRVEYLDVKFHGLQQLGENAGGLMGLDSHEAVMKPLPGCGPNDPKGPRVVLQEGAEELDLDAEAGRGGLLSQAFSTDSEFDLDVEE